ncbi:protein goliath-like, partial [Pollicipes pollicipes]|uniref:protein goliath-like n=1 Tax=Pollicipes pollicipes TaxID=41117 RepID=UPI0018856F49
MSEDEPPYQLPGVNLDATIRTDVIELSKDSGAARALLLCSLLTAARPQAHQIRSDWGLQDNGYVLAFVNVTYREPGAHELSYRGGEIGKYSTGLVTSVTGRLVHARSRNGTAHHGCDAVWENVLPSEPWVALVRRGLCNFDVKVENAYRNNASAVVIYDYKEGRNPHRIHLTSRHRNTIVTIYIPKEQGEDLAYLTDSGIEVSMQITPGKHFSYSVTNLNKTSVLFVSVSFILLMVISLAWLLFYYAQRFRYIHAKDRLAKRLTCAARKALSKIPVQTLKSGDEQLDECECCAVCLEPYRVAEQLRMLPCNHEFHKVCVDPWLLKNRTCPMCKMDILKYYGLSSVSEESIIHLELNSRPERRSSHLESAVFVAGRRSPARSVSRASLQSMSLVMPSPACVESLHSCGLAATGALPARSRRISSV